MKKSIFIFLMVITYTVSAFSPIDEEKIVEVEPQFSGIDCAELAITHYDNLIFQEVDLASAFDAAWETLQFCLENQ